MPIPAIFAEFSKSLNVSAARIVNLPNYVFLCGGEVENTHVLPSSQYPLLGKLSQWLLGKRYAPPPKSLRDVIYREIISFRPNLAPKVLLAEDVFDKFSQSPYEDLLTFEKDLAGFCSLTVIIAESAGSIAELGAFSALSDVSEKVFVVIDDHHYEQKSFIRRGPIEYIKKRDNSKVYAHKWLRGNGIGPLDARFVDIFREDLIDEIEKQIQSAPSTMALKRTIGGHLMFCILGLLEICSVAKFKEIQQFLIDIGADIQRKELLRYLGMLNCLGFLIEKRVGNNDYYYSSRQDTSMRWAYNKAARFRDGIRWSHEFREIYKKNDLRRFRALRWILENP